jgi:hypothetical protein
MLASKVEQIESRKKSYGDLLKGVEKDEAKVKKVYDEKIADILVKRKAFEEQLKALEKDEAKVQKTYDEKVADILVKKKAYEDALAQVVADEKADLAVVTRLHKEFGKSAHLHKGEPESEKKKKKSKAPAGGEGTPEKNESESDTEKKKKKPIPKKVRELVWNTCIGEDVAAAPCTCCEKTTIKNTEFHCGHVLAEANGGTQKVDNLRPICAGCNLSMGTENIDDFKKRFGLGKKEKKA